MRPDPLPNGGFDAAEVVAHLPALPEEVSGKRGGSYPDAPGHLPCARRVGAGSPTVLERAMSLRDLLDNSVGRERLARDASSMEARCRIYQSVAG
jgi:hypothetical protein